MGNHTPGRIGVGRSRAGCSPRIRYSPGLRSFNPLIQAHEINPEPFKTCTAVTIDNRLPHGIDAGSSRLDRCGFLL